MEGRIGELRHGILSVVDSFAQSVALLSLALGVAFASSAAAGETGIAAPFAYLIAGVGSLCLASVIIRFTRRMASAGGLYTYISRGLNPSAGFLGGWLYGGGFAVGISFVLVIGSFFMQTAFTAHTSLHWGWYTWFFIMLAALAAIALLDVKLSSRIQLVLAAVGVADHPARHADFRLRLRGAAAVELSGTGAAWPLLAGGCAGCGPGHEIRVA